MTEIDISKVLIEGDTVTIMGVKYKRIEEPQTLYDVIAQWYLDSVTDNIDLDVPTCINILLDEISLWLPKPQSAAGSQNAYVECSVEGFNDCLDKIKRKLR